MGRRERNRNLWFRLCVLCVLTVNFAALYYRHGCHPALIRYSMHAYVYTLTEGVMAKVRMQILLEDKQKKMLERLAKVQKSSVGQIIREAVDEYEKSRSQEERVLTDDDPLWRIVGIIKTKDTDLSEEHYHCIYGTEKRSKKRG